MTGRWIQILASAGSGMLTFLAGCSGVGTSRWAMDDPIYAEKYDKPYEGNDGDKMARMLKQSLDARHVRDRSGCHVGGAFAETAAGLDIGGFLYHGSAIEARTSLKAVGGAGTGELMVGLEPGLRIQTPSRLAPFAGVGTFIGSSWPGDSKESDGFDNDFNGWIDDHGESDAQSLITLFPELGVHFWMNSDTRITASAQYHFSSLGRDEDFLFFGLGIAYLKPVFSPDPDDQ